MKIWYNCNIKQKVGDKIVYYYKRIRDLREDNDKTQAEIALYLGLKQQQYQRYECGTTEIPLHFLIMLAELYNVTLDYITGRSDIKRIIK